VLIGVPIWFVVGILVTFSPEIATSLGMSPAPKTADAVFWCYFGLALGDLSSGALSQLLRGRRRVVLLFLLLSIPAYWLYFEKSAESLTWFKTACFACGFASGYWAVFVTLAAEQFGTNIRATVATTAPNFVRGTVPLLTTMFVAWKPERGPDGSALLVGAVSLVIALLALTRVEETYGKELDYVE
jgi:MFS transporter, putative metabolite:H+ symporter